MSTDRRAHATWLAVCAAAATACAPSRAGQEGDARGGPPPTPHGQAGPGAGPLLRAPHAPRRCARAGVESTIGVAAGGAVREAARDARGAIDASWRSGAHVSRELDGTADDGRDTDEEWSVEMAVPFASLGMRGQPGERAGFAVERCDAPARGERVCGQWGEDGREGGQLVIE